MNETTGNTDTTRRTVAALGAAVTEELDAEYTLVYAEQGQELPGDVVAALVRGDNELETEGGESLSEWESEARWVAACDAVDQLAKEIVRRWEREDDTDHDELLDMEWPGSTERESAIETVLERDRTVWYDGLIKQHGSVLLRVGIAAMDEDAGLSYTPLTPEAFLDLLGFEHTPENLTSAAEVVDNASPEFSVVMGYALLGVDLADIVSLPNDDECTVELRNPHVWLGSPFVGSGWCSEKPFTGTLTVPRGELRTDDDAFGYSWSEVVGGTHPGYFGGSLAVAAPQPPVTEPTAD